VPQITDSIADVTGLAAVDVRRFPPLLGDETAQSDDWLD
jgi:hypothetical protein